MLIFSLIWLLIRVVRELVCFVIRVGGWMGSLRMKKLNCSFVVIVFNVVVRIKVLMKGLLFMNLWLLLGVYGYFELDLKG